MDCFKGHKFKIVNVEHVDYGLTFLAVTEPDTLIPYVTLRRLDGSHTIQFPSGLQLASTNIDGVSDLPTR